MTDLRAAAQQALEALESMTRHFGFARLGSSSLADTMKRGDAHVAINNLRAALAQEQAEPVQCNNTFGCRCPKHFVAEQAEPVQEPYTDDVTRIMREAGMTFHLGLPHKAVVEQMTRVIDLVYAETSIKAAQQFATAPPKLVPLTEEEIDRLMQSIGLRCADDGNERMSNHAEWERRERRRIARAVERALEEKNGR